MDQVQRVAHRPSQPVQGVHHDHMAPPGEPQHRPKPRPVHRRPGLVVQVDPLPGDPDRHQRVDLPLQVLPGGRHPRVPQLHPATVRELGGVQPTRHAVVGRLPGYPSERGILPQHRQERAVSLPPRRQPTPVTNAVRATTASWQVGRRRRRFVDTCHTAPRASRGPNVRPKTNPAGSTSTRWTPAST